MSLLVVQHFTTHSNQKWALWADMCGLKAIFSLFLAPLGPHLGYSGSGKWPKLINLNVLSVVPTLFQTVPLNMWAYMAIFLKILILALFWPFWALLKA